MTFAVNDLQGATSQHRSDILRADRPELAQQD
jgi:hypothetical protein